MEIVAWIAHPYIRKHGRWVFISPHGDGFTCGFFGFTVYFGFTRKWHFEWQGRDSKRFDVPEDAS